MLRRHPISRPTIGFAMCSTTSTAMIGAAAQANARTQSRKIAARKTTITPTMSTGLEPRRTKIIKARCELGSGRQVEVTCRVQPRFGPVRLRKEQPGRLLPPQRASATPRRAAQLPRPESRGAAAALRRAKTHAPHATQHKSWNARWDWAGSAAPRRSAGLATSALDQNAGVVFEVAVRSSQPSP